MLGRSGPPRCGERREGNIIGDPGWSLVLAALPVAGAIVIAVVPRWAEATERRRTRYAKAVRGLVAWAEFPYRIARRVDDEPGTLRDLARLGHSLQEGLALHGAWIETESPRMARLYKYVAVSLRTEVGQAMQEAWNRPPSSVPADMNVGDLGIDQSRVAALIDHVSQASRTRFGWRRLLGPLNRQRTKFSAR